MKNYSILIITLLPFLILSQQYSKVRITILDSNDDKRDFEIVYNLLGLDVKDPIRKIEYRMYNESPTDGDYIIFFPKDKRYSPLIRRISTKKIIGKPDSNPNTHRNAINDPNLKRIVSKGKLYYYMNDGYYNPSNELLIKYNEEQRRFFNFNISDNIRNELLSGSKLMSVKVERDTNKVDYIRNKPIWDEKRYFNYDTLYYTSKYNQFLNVKVEDRPELFEVHDFMSSYQNIRLFHDNLSLADLDSGVQKSYSFFTKNENGISKDFLAGSEDSLAIKTVVNPNTGREIGKIVGKEDQITGKYMYGFDQKIKIIKTEDETGIEYPIGVPEDFDGEVGVKKVKIETGKISKLMLVGLSMALLYFFAS